MPRIRTGTFKDLQDAIETTGIGQEPPGGLIPVGDSGLYRTPDTPADPRDCERYPDSPYCGGNPFTKTPIGVEVSTTLQVADCGVTRSISITPVLGFTKLPPITAAHIPENCREEYENQGKYKPPKPPSSDRDNYEPTPQYAPYGFDADARVCVVTVDHLYDETQEYNWEAKDWRIAIYQTHGETDEIEYPGKAIVPWYNATTKPTPTTTSLVSAYGTAPVYQKLNAAWMRDYHRDFSGDYTTTQPVYVELHIPTDYPLQREKDNLTKGGNYQGITYFPTGRPGVNTIAIYIGRFGDIFPRKQISPIVNVKSESTDGQRITRKIVFHERFVVYCKRLSGDSSDRLPPPIKKPKKECCDDMGCCQPPFNNQQQIDLNEIKKMLRDLTKRVGVSEYPVKIPETFNVEYNDAGKKTEPKVVKEENLTSLLGRALRIFDGIVGEWGVGFKIQDADPSKPGDQPKFVHAPNMAELMSEMYAHIFDIWIMQYQAMHVSQRHSVESMLARKVGIQNHFLLEALVDWAGFKHKDIVKKIPFLFDIDAEKYDDFVKNKEIELQVIDFDPDDKNAQSFADDMMILKRAAGIIEAVHTRKFKKGSNIPEELKKILLDSAEGLKRVNNDELRTSASEDDFEQWLRDAENAFINRVGQGDINNPYGVPYANRPRLTKIQDSLTGGQDDGD